MTIGLTKPVPVPDAGALLFDPKGFDLERYCGVFLVPDSENAAIVETAASPTVDKVLGAIDTAGIARDAVQHVFVTHIHLDHAGAAWRLLEELPNAKLVVHESGAPFLTDADKVQKLLASVERAVGERFPLYGTFEAVDPDRVITVGGGETFEVAGRRFDIHDAPGHAPHHYVVNDPTNRVVYAGDTLGIRTPNGPLLLTTPPPRFDLEAWKGTLDMLEGLEAKWALLTHFGWVRAKDQIPQYRLALQKWVEDVRSHKDKGVSEAEAITLLGERYPEGRHVYDDATFDEETHMNVRGVWLWMERGA